VTRQQDVHNANIITVAISSDESLVATGSTDRTIAIFSLAAVADESPLQPLLVIKVTEAVCLDISWGRCRNPARGASALRDFLLLQSCRHTTSLLRVLHVRCTTPAAVVCSRTYTFLLLCHSNIRSPHVCCLSFPR
jgi:WD40 repeat protein